MLISDIFFVADQSWCRVNKMGFDTLRDFGCSIPSQNDEPNNIQNGVYCEPLLR